MCVCELLRFVGSGGAGRLMSERLLLRGEKKREERSRWGGWLDICGYYVQVRTVLVCFSGGRGGRGELNPYF